MVHPDVIAHISSFGGPLNAPANDARRSCAAAYANDPRPHQFNVQFATNLPPSLQHGTRVQPKWGSWIVGLYEGGFTFTCGVFDSNGGRTCMDGESLQVRTYTAGVFRPPARCTSIVLYVVIYWSMP
jgi:hypothetical protein